MATVPPERGLRQDLPRSVSGTSAETGWRTWKTTTTTMMMKRTPHHHDGSADWAVEFPHRTRRK
jgi:hypothetical protein